MNSNSFFSRIQLLSALIFLFALLLIAKLFFVQIIHSEDYAKNATDQYTKPSDGVFERGAIYFTRRDGATATAAKTVSGFKVVARPKELLDSESAFTKVSSIVPVTREVFFAQVTKPNAKEIEIVGKISKEEADKIIALNIAGIKIVKQNWRFNPGENLASHTLGFVAFKGNDLAGRYGLERSYNNILSRGKDGLYLNFFAEVFSNINQALFERGDKEGDIKTTIEPSVERFLEERLKEIQEKWNAQSAGGIIMDPKTGAILAMAKAPGFNINDFSKIEDTKQLSNPLVENVFEFGSVIKPLVMAAALDQGVVTPTTTYTDRGFVVVNKARINNFDKKARGANTSMQDVLNQSLNTGMVFVESKLGNERFRNYMLSYGIGEKTGIDLPNETKGIVNNLQSTRDIEYANAAFGQGIALTPIEAVRAFSALANGGRIVSPHLVESILYKNGGTKVFEYPQGPQVIKKETADTITQMLVTVVDKAMLSGAYKMEHYSIAAKTGTAQMAKENGGGYYDDRRLHSFFGYFPAYQPRFVVFFYTVDPKGVQFAAQSLLPPFFETAKFLLSYYDVAPDR